MDSVLADLRREKIQSVLGTVREDGYRKIPDIGMNYVRWLVDSKLGNEEYIMRNILGNHMILNINRKGISKSLAVLGKRERQCIEILSEVLEEDMTVLDLGANIGYYTLIFASQLNKEGTVHAIEPHPHNFKLLSSNIKMNGFEDIVNCHQLAVSDSTGTASLREANRDNVHSIGSSSDEGIRVRTTTVPQFISEHGSLDLIRMDIEGYEEKVLDSICENEPEQLPEILFEVHSNKYTDKFEKIIETMIDSGYKARYVTSKDENSRTFQRYGYSPTKIVYDDRNKRGIYENIQDTDLIDLLDDTRDIYLTNDHL